jgi:hypothetical protein
MCDVGFVLEDVIIYLSIYQLIFPVTPKTSDPAPGSGWPRRCGQR